MTFNNYNHCMYHPENQYTYFDADVYMRESVWLYLVYILGR